MTSAERAARPAAWADPTAWLWLVGDAATIAQAELLKIARDPLEMLSRATQPVLWLVVFGQVLASARAIPTGNVPYLDYLTPGILGQSALFSAIFYGIAVVWERDLGLVHKLLVSPAPRASLVLGKAIAGGLRGLVQAVMATVVAILIGVHVRLEPGPVLLAAATVVLGAGLFATFSLVVACIVRTRERFMGIGQLLTMPVFFASSAIYPISFMPDWLKALATINPLTYMVDALRSQLVAGSASEHGVALDMVALAVAFVLLVALGARLYPRLAE